MWRDSGDVSSWWCVREICGLCCKILQFFCSINLSYCETHRPDFHSHIWTCRFLVLAWIWMRCMSLFLITHWKKFQVKLNESLKAMWNRFTPTCSKRQSLQESSVFGVRGGTPVIPVSWCSSTPWVKNTWPIERAQLRHPPTKPKNFQFSILLTWIKWSISAALQELSIIGLNG